jgi:hypothetical protein
MWRLRRNEICPRNQRNAMWRAVWRRYLRRYLSCQLGCQLLLAVPESQVHFGHVLRVSLSAHLEGSSFDTRVMLRYRHGRARHQLTAGLDRYSTRSLAVDL